MSTILTIIAIIVALIVLANLVFGALIMLMTNPVLFLIVLVIGVFVYVKIRHKIPFRKN